MLIILNFHFHVGKNVSLLFKFVCRRAELTILNPHLGRLAKTLPRGLNLSLGALEVKGKRGRLEGTGVDNGL